MAVATTLYALAGALTAVWAALVLLPLRTRSGPDPDAVQLGMLRAGARRALSAAVTELYAAGAVHVAAQGALGRGEQPLPEDASPVARAAYRALAVRRTLRGLRIRSQVRQALAQTAGQLAAGGLAPSAGRWRAARAIQLLIVVLAMGAVTRAGAMPPLLVLPAVLFVAASLAAWRVPRRTVAGTRLLRRLQREQAGRWDRRRGEELVESWTPARAAQVHALTGMVLAGLEPALRRDARARRMVEGRMDLGDGVSAYRGGYGQI